MRQGRAIIIFTVMTIIFVSHAALEWEKNVIPDRMKQLPLGFIASIFGMNNKQISGDEMPMTLRSQFRYMCTFQKPPSFLPVSTEKALNLTTGLIWNDSRNIHRNNLHCPCDRIQQFRPNWNLAYLQVPHHPHGDQVGPV